jgi:hypothetical protein
MRLQSRSPGRPAKTCAAPLPIESPATRAAGTDRHIRAPRHARTGAAWQRRGRGSGTHRRGNELIVVAAACRNRHRLPPRTLFTLFVTAQPGKLERRCVGREFPTLPCWRWRASSCPGRLATGYCALAACVPAVHFRACPGLCAAGGVA